MAGPSNIRVNPFTGTGGATNYIELTEKHIIPANSPYVIRLNEVPEKQDPSNMKVVYVNISTGVATSTTLTEVAATPGQGEFRPDYSTNAMEDNTWNTGLIEFSASDAGKMIQITYTGTGTLAGVNSNHWPSWYIDRGDGSDGDFIPTGSTIISGVKNYKSVFIKSGVTLTVGKAVKIKCMSGFVNYGTINADGQGSAGAFGKENGSDGFLGGNGGAALSGGNGGTGYSDVFGLGKSIELSTMVGDTVPGIILGAGGGGFQTKGGNGGGSIFIICNEFLNKGTITANGQNANNVSSGSNNAGGGGGGGGVVVVAHTIKNSGNITANGGKGGTSVSGQKSADGDKGIVLLKELGV